MNEKLSIGIFVLLSLILLTQFFVLGVKYSDYFKNSNLITVGYWKKINETNRNIAIRVDNQDLVEILDTARHEICHEIDYRLNNQTITYNETFAETCNPEDYLYLDNE